MDCCNVANINITALQTFIDLKSGVVIRYRQGRKSCPVTLKVASSSGGGLCPPKGGGAMVILTELRKFMQALASLIRALKMK